MYNLGVSLARRGVLLRTGGARGADTSFLAGCRYLGGPEEVYLAKHATPEAMHLASLFHPNWKGLSPYVKQLMGRNVLVALGPDFISPVDFLVCWTREGRTVGGTGHTIKVAKAASIPVYNLAVSDDIHRLTQRISTIGGFNYACSSQEAQQEVYEPTAE